MSYKTDTLNSQHKKRDFNCRQSALDTYIQKQASQDYKRQFSVCFVLANVEQRVVGYYTNSELPCRIFRV